MTDRTTVKKIAGLAGMAAVATGVVLAVGTGTADAKWGFGPFGGGGSGPSASSAPQQTGTGTAGWGFGPFGPGPTNSSSPTHTNVTFSVPSVVTGTITAGNPTPTSGTVKPFPHITGVTLFPCAFPAGGC